MGQTCIILAGGRGTRLRSVLEDLPKCLAPIGDRPFLQMQMEFLAEAGVTDFILSLGYKADAVMAVLPELQRRFQVVTVIERDVLGTGGAVLNAMNEQGLTEALVINGDSIFDGDLSAMFDPLKSDLDEKVRMATVVVPDRHRFGGVTLEGDKVTGFLPKGQAGAGIINAGLYRISRSAFGAQLGGSSFSIENDTFPDLVKAGSVRARQVGTDFTDIGVPEDYARFKAVHTHG